MMVGNFFTDEEVTCGNRYVAVQKDVQNAMDRICEQWRYFKDNGNKKDS